jgi:hypothetical protein
MTMIFSINPKAHWQVYGCQTQLSQSDREINHFINSHSRQFNLGGIM